MVLYSQKRASAPFVAGGAFGPAGCRTDKGALGGDENRTYVEGLIPQKSRKGFGESSKDQSAGVADKYGGAQCGHEEDGDGGLAQGIDGHEMKEEPDNDDE